jgi:mRNA interferase MazF
MTDSRRARVGPRGAPAGQQRSWSRLSTVRTRAVQTRSWSAEPFRTVVSTASGTGPNLSVAAEVAIGAPEGLPFQGVLRVAFPRPGVVPCTWLFPVTREDLVERVSTLPAAKLAEIENLVRLGGPA